MDNFLPSKELLNAWMWNARLGILCCILGFIILIVGGSMALQKIEDAKSKEATAKTFPQ